MASHICLSCRMALRLRTNRPRLPSSLSKPSRLITSSATTKGAGAPSRRWFSDSARAAEANPEHERQAITRDREAQKKPIDFERLSLLPKQTWSVKSLIPPTADLSTNEVTPEQLNHLLRLSALPEAKPGEETERKLQDLHAQLYFLRDVQKVDTTGIEPLTSIVDESEEGIAEATINLDDEMEQYLAEETIVGNMRRRRRAPAGPAKGPLDVNLLKNVKKVGPYFVVDNTGSKELAAEDEASAKGA